MTIAGKKVLVSRSDRADQQTVLYGAAIDEQELMIRHAAAERRQSRHTTKAGRAAQIVDAQAIGGKIPVRERCDPGRPVIAGLNRQGSTPVMIDAEAYIWPGHGQTFHDIDTGGIFRALRTKELAPCRDPLEQGLNADSSAGGECRRALPLEPTVINLSRPAVAATDPAFYAYPRYACDRWQGFASKPEGCHLIDGVVRQFGSRMALKRKGDFGRSHAATIVGNLDTIQASAAQRNGNPRRPSVDGILDQLLQRTGWSFHHFTRSYAVDDMFGETAY